MTGLWQERGAWGKAKGGGRAEGRIDGSCEREKAAGLTPWPHTFCSLKDEPAPRQPMPTLQRGWAVLSLLLECPHVKVVDVIVGRVGSGLHL